MNKKTPIFEIISKGTYVDYRIYWVKADSPIDAILKYCKCEGLSDIQLKAVEAFAHNSSNFDDIIALVNGWLYDEIVVLQDITDSSLYGASGSTIQVIE